MGVSPKHAEWENVMRICIVAAAAALGLSSFALAEEPVRTITGPVELTDAQMDGVTAGQLVEIELERVTVAVPVNASVAGVCVIVDRCNPDSTATQRGRIRN